jgi:hypothetical protein
MRLVNPPPTLTASDLSAHERELKLLRDHLFTGQLSILQEEEVIAPSLIVTWHPPPPERMLLKGGLKFAMRFPDTAIHATCSVQHWLSDTYNIHVSYVTAGATSLMRLSVPARPQTLVDTLVSCIQKIRR